MIYSASFENGIFFNLSLIKVPFVSIHKTKEWNQCLFIFFFFPCLFVHFLSDLFHYSGASWCICIVTNCIIYIYFKNCCISWKCLYICYPLVDQHMFASHALHKQQYNDIKVQMLFILVCSSLGKNLKKHSRRGARVIAQLGHLPCMCSTHVRSSASHMVP